MSHQEKQRIFDEYARKLRYTDWDQLHRVYSGQLEELTKHIFVACDLVQEEQQKRIAGNVMMKNHDGTSKKIRHLTYFQNGADNIQVDKETIINPENIIS